MKRLSFILFILLASVMNLQANPVDSESAKTLGIKFMTTNTSVRSSQSDLVYTAKTEQGDNAFYVFSVSPKGFVIVSADDRMKPILGYSTESNFNADFIPDGLMTYFDNYKAGAAQMIANNDVRTEQAKEDWTRLAETGKINDSRISRAAGPLMSSIWNQTDLYNNMCPEDPSSVFSGHCKSGCVANAMSQIMRYWEWPRHGQGYHTYYANSYYGNYGWQEANFAEATYRFELMADFLDFASPQDEVDATALLEHHAGVSVDMGYGPSASGAYSDDVPDALLNYFRYSNDMNFQYQGSQSVWENNLRNNIDGGMPLYYASQGDAGGHAYVLDGYDDNNMFHMNWGWAGFDNGYYAIDGFYLTFYSFPWYHNAIFNLHPVAEYYDCPKQLNGMTVSEDGDLRVLIELYPEYSTRNDEPLSSLDTIVLMRDGEIIYRFENQTEPSIIFYDDVTKAGTYYYTAYSINQAGMSKVLRDTITVGATCDLTFELHDAGGNGWDMSFIAILDEDGKIVERVGLWDGSEATVPAVAPSGQEVTFFWTYDNTCYSHGALSEASYEIYDWSGQLIYASDGYPEVGDITTYEMNCGLDCHPVDNVECQYFWDEYLGQFGVNVTWNWRGSYLDHYAVYRDGETIAEIGCSGITRYTDMEPKPGNIEYTVTAVYNLDGEFCESDPVSATVEVTSVGENNTSNEVVSETLFDLSGREIKDREVAAGIYIVRQTLSDGTVRTIRICR